MLKQKTGEIVIGVILPVAVAVIMALVLFQHIASNVDTGTRTNSGTVSVVNQSITSPANGAILELTGQELVGTPIVTIATTGEVIGTANYTISECVRTSDSYKGICYKTIAAAGASKAYNVSYSYYPNGYIDDNGARSITNLIILLTAIGIAMIAFLGIRKDIM